MDEAVGIQDSARMGTVTQLLANALVGTKLHLVFHMISVTSILVVLLIQSGPLSRLVKSLVEKEILVLKTLNVI